MSEKEKQKLDEVETEKVSGGTQLIKKLEEGEFLMHICPKCGRITSSDFAYRFINNMNVNMAKKYINWCEVCLRNEIAQHKIFKEGSN